MPSPSNITVIMPVKDEELNLPHSLPSVIPWADRVYVVDSGSKDRTKQIAADMGAVVVDRPWLGYARQKNWCLDNLDINTGWVLFLDADETILPDLRDELLAIARRPADDVKESGFYLNRYFMFLGKRIRHCGFYPSWNLRFFKRGRARYEEREVHEHMVVDGPEGFLKGHMEHDDRRGLEVYMDKHNKYSTLEARETIRQIRAVREARASRRIRSNAKGANDAKEQRGGEPAVGADSRQETGSQSAGLDARLFGNPLQRRRWIKHVLYPKLPAKWLCRFLFMYIIRLGFLDGLTGLRFCLFMSAYELLIALKIIEMQRTGVGLAAEVRDPATNARASSAS